ncbi:amidohydrolase, partial [Acinetobacter baumannii]
RIRQIVSHLTVVDGRIVYADGPFKHLDTPLPPAAPDWSPVNFGSRYEKAPLSPAQTRGVASSCGCHSACSVHGHAHAWTRAVPVDD